MYRWCLLLAFPGLLAAPVASALEPGLPQRVHTLGGALRLPILRGEPTDLERDAGFGFGVCSHWFYRPGLALAVTADYDRFGSPIDPDDQLSRFTFSVSQLAALPLGRLLPWAAFGAGVGVGLFRRPDGATITDTMPVLRAAGGLALEIHRRTTVGVSAGYDFVFGGDSVGGGTGSGRDTVFDDTAHVALGADYYF